MRRPKAYATTPARIEMQERYCGKVEAMQDQCEKLGRPFIQEMENLVDRWLKEHSNSRMSGGR